MYFRENEMKSPEQESFYSFAFECFRMVPTGAELTIHSPGLSLSHSGNTFYSAEDGDVMVESASVVKEEKAMNSLNS